LFEYWRYRAAVRRRRFDLIRENFEHNIDGVNLFTDVLSHALTSKLMALGKFSLAGTALKFDVWDSTFCGENLTSRWRNDAVLLRHLGYRVREEVSGVTAAPQRHVNLLRTGVSQSTSASACSDW
jgi:hypothetical protein